MSSLRLFLLMLLTLAIAPLQAAQFYRCTDKQGNTLFSQQPCGPNAALQSMPDQIPPAQNQSGTPSPIDQLQNYRDEVRRIDELIGSDSPDRPASPSRTQSNDCDQVSSLQLRNARVSRDIQRCHSEADVRAMKGAPDEVYQWSDRKAYDTRWMFYSDDRKTTTYVYFKNGRVTRWNQRTRAD